MNKTFLLTVIFIGSIGCAKSKSELEKELGIQIRATNKAYSHYCTQSQFQNFRYDLEDMQEHDRSELLNVLKRKFKAIHIRHPYEVGSQNRYLASIFNVRERMFADPLVVLLRSDTSGSLPRTTFVGSLNGVIEVVQEFMTVGTVITGYDADDSIRDTIRSPYELEELRRQGLVVRLDGQKADRSIECGPMLSLQEAMHYAVHGGFVKEKGDPR